MSQDVFLSYAHLDNLPDLPNQQGWVSIFQDALRRRLGKELGRNAQVWWDKRELDGVRPFDDEIRQACDDATVMVAILSPRYIISESCRKELEYFAERRCAPADNAKRLFIVKTTPVDPAELDITAHPVLREAVTTALGYAFRYDDEKANRIFELNTYDPKLAPTYQRLLEVLAQDIAAAIRSSNGANPYGASRPPPRRSGPVQRNAVDSPLGADAVFLAAAGSDVAHVRDALFSELKDRGIAVCAPNAWSDEYTAMRNELLLAVESAGLAVQVVGAHGSRPDGTDKSVPELQFELLEQVARERPRHAPLVRMVWLSPGIEPRSEHQRAFIERVRTYEGWGDADELLVGSREELAERVMAKRKAIVRERQAQDAWQREHTQKAPAHGAAGFSVDDSGEVHRIYVISADRDHERARAVEAALHLPNWEVLSAAEVKADTTDEAEREKQHQAYLAQSDAFVIYHGDAKTSWVRAQADEARKASARRGTKRCLGSVYVARPIQGPKATYELCGIQRVNDLHDDIEQNIRPLTERLLAAYGADMTQHEAGGAP